MFTSLTVLEHAYLWYRAALSLSQLTIFFLLHFWLFGKACPLGAQKLLDLCYLGTEVGMGSLLFGLRALRSALIHWLAWRSEVRVAHVASWVGKGSWGRTILSQAITPGERWCCCCRCCCHRCATRWGAEGDGQSALLARNQDRAVMTCNGSFQSQ